MNGPGLGVKLMFWQSTAMHLRRRRTVGGAMASVSVSGDGLDCDGAGAGFRPRGVFIRPPRDAVTFFDSAGIGGSKGDQSVQLTRT